MITTHSLFQIRVRPFGDKTCCPPQNPLTAALYHEFLLEMWWFLGRDKTLNFRKCGFGVLSVTVCSFHFIPFAGNVTSLGVIYSNLWYFKVGESLQNAFNIWTTLSEILNQLIPRDHSTSFCAFSCNHVVNIFVNMHWGQGEKCYINCLFSRSCVHLFWFWKQFLFKELIATRSFFCGMTLLMVQKSEGQPPFGCKNQVNNTLGFHHH